MCGIAGVFQNGRRDLPSRSVLFSLLEKLKHRGHSLCEVGNGMSWALGAHRLEIVDRANGRQPMYSNDGKIAVVFNGEIYNYLLLREELINAGYIFNTFTDTEVIVHGYAFWGLGLFERLDGMFAILIWDAAHNRFVAARDPVGIKPLYFCNREGHYLFASEIKALVGHSNDIKVFPPGHYWTGDKSPVRYDLRTQVVVADDVAENADSIRDAISQAVAKRVKTDLPIAVFLGGGIDSSIVLYEAIQHHSDVTAFSIGKADSEDVKASRALCEQLKIPLVHVPVTTEELIKIIPEVIWTIESFEPNHIRGGTLSYLLSKEVAKKGYRIALCGEGADELFGGYSEFGKALESGSSRENMQYLFSTFLAQLHKTQLQRVDRTAMRFTLEVRVPLLDKKILDIANALPIEQKVSSGKNWGFRDKIILRLAYKGLLPDEIVSRKKTVLSLGAGFGSNGPEGIFFEHGQKMLPDNQLKKISSNYSEFLIKSSEEAYYFDTFRNFFGALSIVKERPMVNSTPAEMR